jgi:hypothetical protein
MRASLAVVLLLLSAGPVAAQTGRSAAPAGRALSAEQIRDIARRDMVWCENYRAEKGDCETMTLVSLLPDGKLRETGVMRLSRSPDLQLVIDGVSEIRGDQICAVHNEDAVKLRFLMNGRPMPTVLSARLEAMVRESMAEFEGKTLCQTFYRGASADTLSERITVNGARRTDLESTYRLQSDESGLDVRSEEEPEETQV